MPTQEQVREYQVSLQDPKHELDPKARAFSSVPGHLFLVGPRPPGKHSVRENCNPEHFSKHKLPPYQDFGLSPGCSSTCPSGASPHLTTRQALITTTTRDTGCLGPNQDQRTLRKQVCTGQGSALVYLGARVEREGLSGFPCGPQTLHYS